MMENEIKEGARPPSLIFSEEEYLELVSPTLQRTVDDA
jgi:hypothetical protein